jgi:hypothetical protein
MKARDLAAADVDGKSVRITGGDGVGLFAGVVWGWSRGPDWVAVWSAGGPTVVVPGDAYVDFVCPIVTATG